MHGGGADMTRPTAQRDQERPIETQKDAHGLVE